ncbi:DEAD/DEAH box helicase [Actinomadura sp. WMMB 499]|uniref:DEAD/DEAH box helicase n=1 Tax=Actinomadura sp. WMMB 499 TaxID=1219491 RepID=UPI001246F867|nr:DEAD/DEAH box helicase [Actinomadura sp. WMMB 499]QFG20594.1 DEAD/DEAH box helicase [Actinomadura sp. WMMB 499]
MSRPARPPRRGRSARPRPANARRTEPASTPPASSPALPPVDSFAELALPAPLLATLADRDVTAPFPIQAATLPNALAGRDVLGRGRTGSGKTLAFGLPLLARTAGHRAEPRAPLALVLVPTRELAQQVTDALEPYAAAVDLRLATVVGGLSITRQATALARGADVLVATPGRLADLIERGDCRLGRVRVTVLDEADQMTDMGFLPQVTRLLEQTPSGGQRMLFSATLDRNVDRLVQAFLGDPVTCSVDPPKGAVTTMEHHLLHIADTDKLETTAHIAARRERVIMFVAKKHAADRLVRKLTSRGVSAAALHGGKTQSQRNRALEGFRTEAVTVLVATDVAARGIHIDDLDLVVNIDPPADPKDYLHRSGRTARAGRAGTVVTVVLPDQRRDVDAMMAAAGITPRTTRVRPGDSELARITGARVPAPPPAAAAPRRAPQDGGRSRAPQDGGRRREAQDGRRREPQDGGRRRGAQPATAKAAGPKAAGPKRSRPRRRTSTDNT